MIFWIAFLFPVLLGIWNLLLSLSFGTILLSAIGVGLCIFGAVRRVERPVVVGVFCLLIAYGGALVSSEARPQFWTGLAYGLAVFLTIELNFDLRRMRRWKDVEKIWTHRRRYLIQLIISVVVGGFLVTTLAVSFAPGLIGRPAPLVFWIGGVGVVIMAIASAMMLRFWIHDER